MGRKITYSRRKRDRECFNGIQFERPTLVENCECTEDDYECDYGFVRQDEMANSPCVPISQVNYSAPSVCPAGSTYTISSGYRKVSGDTCVGGVVHAPYIIPCPSTSFMSSAGVLTYIVIIAFVIALGVGAFYYKDQIRSIFQKLKGGVKYKKLGTGEAENDEELVFNPKDSQTPVSYTHLTLPTILLVQISVVAVSLKKKNRKTLKRRHINKHHCQQNWTYGQALQNT
eukprot:TRINITY_DN9620_c0_g1_i2.p1 TRINITY_DN9620_c0_g1~~TRINITY_DN9620_c0_g1_i2.p1  ORF type:complete len:248 (-),score=26.78 TRINITY_DN9620_c0_g1_i2:34-720(-)